MYKGEPTAGIDFYNLLMETEEFTTELGKVALTSGKLEAELFILIKQSDAEKKINKKSTLGPLIDLAEKIGLLDKNMILALKETLAQRNYITHNIYALFTDQIEQTILEKDDLLDTDVRTYIERVFTLNCNLEKQAEIIQRKNQLFRQS